MLSTLLRVSAITISALAAGARPVPVQGAAGESPAPRAGVAQAASRSAAFWRASALDDVEAAYRMLREDHPGAAPEIGDRQFQKTLEEAHMLAASDASQVDSFAGYAATLARFANAFGDKHVRSRPVLVVSNWRDLGAIQLGQTTDADTHYTEVRDDPMPSGLSTFSTMMGVDMNSPAREGPFVPNEIYEGDIRDTPALEAWVLRFAAQRGTP